MRLNRTLPFAIVLLGLVLIPRLAWWERDSIELELGVAGPPPGPGAANPPAGLEWMLSHLKARPAGRDGWNILPGEHGASGPRSLSTLYLTGGLHEAMSVPRESGPPSAAAPPGAPGALGRAGAGDPLKEHRGRWLRAADARALSGFTSRGGTVVAEGGLLASVQDAEAQWRVEDCFRVRWTGWIGLSVDDIGDPSQAPEWILRRLRGAGDTTTLSGPAVVLVKGDQILVLRGGIEVEDQVHEITWMSSAQLVSGKGVSPSVPFRGWFEVVKAGGGCEVLAEHKLRVTDLGERKLASAGLSKSFPCFVGYRGAHASYYMAASFSQDGPSDFWVRVAGYPKLASLVCAGLGGSRCRAFWGFYYPLMKQVIFEARKSREDA